ncbi:hypothetical protein CHUAL_009635 [Chamberlinius hualienensis]
MAGSKISGLPQRNWRNYHTWCQDMELALQAHGLLKYTMGTVVPLAADSINLRDALYTPSSRVNLILSAKLDNAGCKQVISNGQYKVYAPNGQVALIAKKVDGSYIVDFSNHRKDTRSISNQSKPERPLTYSEVVKTGPKKAVHFSQDESAPRQPPTNKRNAKSKSSNGPTDFDTWHKRLCYVNEARLK